MCQQKFGSETRESNHSPAVFLVARIGLCGLVTWLVTSVKATGHRKWETAIYVTRTEIGTPWASAGRAQGSNPLQKWHPFVGKCQLSTRHFCECWACLGNSPALWSTLKKPCVVLIRLVGCTANKDCKQMSSGSFKNVISKICVYKYIYIYIILYMRLQIYSDSQKYWI